MEFKHLDINFDFSQNEAGIKRPASVDGMWLQTDQFPIATQL
jgi:hypothetical protein